MAVAAGGGGFSAAAAAPAPVHDFAVLAYDVDLEIDRDRRMIVGREDIRVRALANKLEVVSFPQNGIRVLSMTSSGGAPVEYVEADGRIDIRLPRVLARNQRVSFTVRYQALRPKGVEFQADAVYTFFHTCHWMVCREEPDGKATFSLSAAVPADLTLVASGAPAGRPRPAGGRTRYTWKEGVPSSTYLYGFAIGRFRRTVRRYRDVTFEYYTVNKDDDWVKRAFADDDRMLDFFVDKAGRRLPRSFYRQVVVEGDAAQEMSSFSVLGRAYLEARLTEPEEDWLIAHEMAHQFWGNMVTCASWSHFWLNEGLTVFMVAAYKERRWGRAAYEHELNLVRERYQAAVDAHFDVPLAFEGEYPSLKLKRAIVYSKAALFLDRLRAGMGEQAFWSALRAYTRRFAGKSAVSRDFQQVFAAAAGRRVGLSALFDEWVYGGKGQNVAGDDLRAGPAEP